MAAIERRIPPCQRAKNELLARAEELKRQNGALPPERELSELIGVSRSTLRKALDELTSESCIVNIPRKGNFLTGAPARRKIAIVMDGSNIPYPAIIAGTLEALDVKLLWIGVQTIKDFDELQAAIRNFGFEGIVWLDPSERNIQDIAEGARRLGNAALVAAKPFCEEMAPGFPIKSNLATMDKDAAGALRAEFLLGRGHKRIAYAAKSQGRSFESFLRVHAEHGLEYDRSLSIGFNHDLPEKLSALLDRNAISALATDGGVPHLERVFCTLNSHPRGHEIEVEAPEVPELAALLKRYPRVKIAGITKMPYRQIGMAAAEMLMEAMDGRCASSAIKRIAPTIEEAV